MEITVSDMSYIENSTHKSESVEEIQSDAEDGAEKRR